MVGKLSVKAKKVAYQLHDTVHVEKRARQRGFTLDQIISTVNEPGSILKLRSDAATMAA